MSLLSVSAGSIASSNLGQNSFDSPPAFLQNTGAVMMTDGQMASVQGEFIIVTAAVITLTVIGLSYALMLTGDPNGIRLGNDFINKL